MAPGIQPIPNLKDRKVLFALDQNSRLPLSLIAKKAGLSKEVAHYRVEALRKSGILKKCYAIIDTGKLGFVSHKLYLQLQGVNRKTENEIINYLKNRPEVFWIATCSGKWDLLFGSWARNTLEFNDMVLTPFLERYSDFVLAKDLTVTRANIQWNRRWFHDTGEAPIEATVGGEPTNVGIDETDVKILHILKNDARKPIVEIARELNTTSMVVSYRLKKLEKEKLIQAYRVALDLKRLGYEFCKAFVYLRRTDTKRLEQLIRYCRQRPQILNAVTCVGSWELELEFEVPSFEEFHAIMKDIREEFGDMVKSYESVLISEEPKVEFMPPI